MPCISVGFVLDMSKNAKGISDYNAIAQLKYVMLK